MTKTQAILACVTFWILIFIVDALYGTRGKYFPDVNTITQDYTEWSNGK